MQKTGIIIFACLLFFSCRPKETSQENVGFQYRGDTLVVVDHSSLLDKIHLLIMQRRMYSPEFNTTGTVKAIPGQLAEIAPPFDGRIVKSYVHLGQRVSAGTPILELSSIEFYEASKAYFQALQTKKMMEVNLQRQKDLVQHGVGIQKELEEAETNHELAQKEFENTVAGLRMFNINPSELVMGQPLKVVSPIAGEIVQSNIIIGQFVKNDTPPLAIVAELNKVWIVAQVKEKYIEAIRPDDKVEIRTDADPEHPVMGRVYHINELLDEETRSVQVLIACDNENRKLKPGMFASVHFISQPTESLLIPASALLQSESNSFVFVEVGKNKYVKRSVKAISANQNEVLITEGLEDGDAIISTGGIYLMAN